MMIFNVFVFLCGKQFKYRDIEKPCQALAKGIHAKFHLIRNTSN